MIMLTTAEHQELLDCRDQLRAMFGDTEESLRYAAGRLVAACDAHGFVLTVEQWAVPPLAMGRYQTVFDIRPARVPS